MKIVIGSDHRGYPLKEALIKFFKETSVDFKDVGTNSADSVDYSDFAKLVGDAVVNSGYDVGILICGSGIGVSMAANKVRGIRAVNATDNNMAEMARRHNNANVICFGSDFIDLDKAKRFLEIFINTEFEGGERHIRRIQKLENN
ncbi:MAG: ribose 5-phosphate isomerase B [Ignavibacteriota bacterium]|nr:ribose 5-phosphate isomerase B [Ignavibacteriota bacterium]